MAYLVITQATPTESPRYFGYYLTKYRTGRAQEILEDLGYTTQVVELENADELWVKKWEEQRNA